MGTPDSYLKNWFQYLDDVRQCAAQISNDVADDVVTFSSQKVALILPGDPQKDQLRSCIFEKCHLYVPNNAFTQKTFFEFIEYIYQPLRGFIVGVFKRYATGASSGTDPVEFEAKISSDVFRTDSSRQQLVDALRSDMPDTWFPSSKIGKVMDALSSTKAIKAVVDLVASAGDKK